MRTAHAKWPLLATSALFLALGGCSDDNAIVAPTPTPPVATPAPTPPPTPTPTPPTVANFNVTPCLQQTVIPGRTVADLVVPDTLRVDFNAPAGFPNGRRYQDPVIDLTLAAVFLDLRVHPINTFASLPLNPSGNDRQFDAFFPFLAPPHGNPPRGPVGGANYNFRTEAASAYTRVDRMGMPAVATALVGSANKNAFNDDNPAIDATGKWVPEFVTQLTALTNALADDLVGLGLTPCARPAT